MEPNELFSLYKETVIAGHDHSARALFTRLHDTCVHLGRPIRNSFPHSDQVNGEIFDSAEQEIILKLLDRETVAHIHPQSFATWYRTVLHRKLIDASRYMKGKKRNMANVSLESLPDLTRSEDAQHIDIGHLRSRILKSLETLPLPALEAFCLHLEGSTYEQVSQILHLPPGTVKSRIHQAHRKLEHILGEASELSAGELEGLHELIPAIRAMVGNRQLGVAI